MSIKETLKHEAIEFGLVTSYFLVGFGIMLLLFKLILSEYHISFVAAPKVLFAALVLGKVVMILGKLPFMNIFHARPAWLSVGFKTSVYVVGVALVVIAEKLFHLTRETGDLSSAWAEFIRAAHAQHSLAQVILVGGLIAGYCALEVISEALGPGRLRRLFFAQRPHASTDAPATPG